MFSTWQVASLALVTVVAEDFFKKQSSSTLSLSRDFVSTSDHNHKHGTIMSSILSEESMKPERCLLSHQFKLSLSLYILEGSEDDMYVSWHHEKDSLWSWPTSLFFKNVLIFWLFWSLLDKKNDHQNDQQFCDQGFFVSKQSRTYVWKML